MKRIAVTKKKAILGAVIALVIFGISVGALIYFRNNINTNEPAAEPLPVQDVPLALDKYIQDGKVDEGMEFIDSQIEAQESQSNKQSLLVYKSQFATQAGRTDVALESAEQANDIAPSTSSNLALAEAYEKRGDKKQAAAYYQQVVDSIEENTFMSRYKHIWEDKVKELSS